MLIELRGVEFVNKGAELMLYAIIDQLKSQIPNVQFAMELSPRSPKTKLDQLGILEKAKLIKKGFDLTFIYKLVPAKRRMRHRLILDSEIDVVLDGSGFAYGDKWGAKKAGKRTADHIEVWKRQGKKTILLPQAFGPFSSEELKNKMQIILNNADLIFARDEISLSNLKALKEQSTNLYLAPDFTNLLKGTLPERLLDTSFDLGIIPNQKMLETTNKANNEEYPHFLKKSIELLQKHGRKPFFLIHESNDAELAEQINSMLNKKIPMFVESDPLVVKAIIGASFGIITSRFHGLVSALSQGIPCLSTGWSHKYEMLLKDYGYTEGLCELGKEPSYYEEKLSLILDTQLREKSISNLILKSKEQKKLSQDMWNRTISTIKNK